MVATQLSDNRRLLIETQVQQDLRASMDIITRQLRRDGALPPALALLGLATPTTGGQKSDYAGVTVSGSTGNNEIGFRYVRNPSESGLRVQARGWRGQVADGSGRLAGTDRREHAGGDEPRDHRRHREQRRPALRQAVQRRRHTAAGPPSRYATTWSRSAVTPEATPRCSARSAASVRLRNDWVRFERRRQPVAGLPGMNTGMPLLRRRRQPPAVQPYSALRSAARHRWSWSWCCSSCSC